VQRAAFEGAKICNSENWPQIGELAFALQNGLVR